MDGLDGTGVDDQGKSPLQCHDSRRLVYHALSFIIIVGEHNGRSPIHTMSQHTFSSSNAVLDTELELVEDVNVSSLKKKNKKTKNLQLTSIFCNTAICSPGCQNGGTCVHPNTCQCPSGQYTGSLCQTRNIVKACSYCNINRISS